MSGRWRALAPGKVNLCLIVGPLRPDGRHELVSLIEPVSLADELLLEPAPEASEDQVVCPGVAGTNLAAAALTAWRRASGWEGAAVRLTIAKHVPVAAGMGGGSGDAAAALRLAARAAGRPGDPALADIAAELGADVPGQLRPGPALVGGAGEEVEAVPAPAGHGWAVVPVGKPLSTASVYAEADRRGLVRDASELPRWRARLTDWLQGARELDPELMVNDLQDAARALCPEIDGALADVRAAGAAHALVSGSGPTVLGLFAGPDAAVAAEAAARELHARWPAAVAATPVDGRFAAEVEA